MKKQDQQQESKKRDEEDSGIKLERRRMMLAGAGLFTAGCMLGDASLSSTASASVSSAGNVTIFDLIADLRANTDSGYSFVYVAGHSQLGMGGGWFILDTSDTITADDGGLNIVDSQSPRTGTWRRV